MPRIEPGLPSIRLALDQIGQRIKNLPDKLIDTWELSHDMAGRVTAENIRDVLRNTGHGAVAESFDVFATADRVIRAKLNSVYDEAEELGERYEPVEPEVWAPATHWWNSIRTFPEPIVRDEDISNSARAPMTGWGYRVSWEISLFCAEYLTATDRWCQEYAVEGMVENFCGFEVIQKHPAVVNGPLAKRTPSGVTFGLRYDEDRASYVELLLMLWAGNRQEIQREVLRRGH